MCAEVLLQDDLYLEHVVGITINLWRTDMLTGMQNCICMYNVHAKRQDKRSRLLTAWPPSVVL